jgi:hypothetical protein
MNEHAVLNSSMLVKLSCICIKKYILLALMVEYSMQRLMDCYIVRLIEIQKPTPE